MRVMLFTDTYVPHLNGVATSVCNLARRLTEQGHQVLVYTAGGEIDANESFRVVRTRALRIVQAHDVGLAAPVDPMLGRILKEFRPDIIHCHTPFGVGWQGVLASRIGHVPLMGTHHSHPDVFSAYMIPPSLRSSSLMLHVSRSITSNIAASFYNRCDVVSCASRFLADDMHASGVRQQVLITPNLIDTSLFRPHQPAPAGSDQSDGLKLVYFGRLASDKNLYQLLEIVKPVLAASPHSVLRLVGDGPEREGLARSARSLGIERQVCFTGRLQGEDLARAVATSDICVTASLVENQPMSLLESLACGVPVVAVAAGGIPEIIRNGYNGFVIAHSDAMMEQFRHRLIRLATDAALYQTMRANACMSVRHHTLRCLQAIYTAYETTAATAQARIGRRRRYA